jgi:hypothetical protein
VSRQFLLGIYCKVFRKEEMETCFYIFFLIILPDLICIVSDEHIFYIQKNICLYHVYDLLPGRQILNMWLMCNDSELNLICR